MSDTSSNSVTIDPSNHLYLHPSDHPGRILVSKTFESTGFAIWKRAMTIALSAKNKLDFVKNPSSAPSNPSQFALWERCNNMIISWINTLSREIAESVLYTESIYQLWAELNDRYGKANGAKLYQLQKNLCEITQGNSDIATYFAKIKLNWDELNALNLFPSCTCAASAVIAKNREDQQLIQFLMGLNPSYDVVRGTILMMQPLPTINQAYALLIQDEKQREISSIRQFSSESASMNVNSQIQGTQYGRFDNKKNLVCSHCKKTSHTANKCYRLVGFPKDFKFTKSKCGNANMASDENLGSSISVEQYHELVKLLQQTQLPKDPSENQNINTSINYANFAGPFNEEATGSW